MQCNRAQPIHHTMPHAIYNTVQYSAGKYKQYTIHNTIQVINTHAGWSLGFIRNNRYKCSLAVKGPVCPSSWTNSANKTGKRVKEHIQFREVVYKSGITGEDTVLAVVLMGLKWLLEGRDSNMCWPGFKHSCLISPALPFPGVRLIRWLGQMVANDSFCWVPIMCKGVASCVTKINMRYQTVTDEVRTEVQNRLIKACGGITLSISISKIFFKTFSMLLGGN